MTLAPGQQMICNTLLDFAQALGTLGNLGIVIPA